MNKQPELFPATQVVVDAVRDILGMNTLDAEQRKLSRRQARYMLRMWLWQIGQAPEPTENIKSNNPNNESTQ